jgi:hypothetical protein
MRQASELSAITSRDVLGSRADIMRQASEHTAQIQIEALKNKECLSRQMECYYDRLSNKIEGSKDLQYSIDTARIRDNQNEFRLESFILKDDRWRDRHGHHHHHYGHHGHHDGRREHIHNNLYSNYGHEERRGDDDREGRDGREGGRGGRGGDGRGGEHSRDGGFISSRSS